MAEILKTGKYLGKKNTAINYEGILITDTTYTKSDEFAAHSHENLYIAYVVQGHYIETTGTETKRCLPGSVIFHRVGERHSNRSFAEKNRILNAEIPKEWFDKQDMSYCDIEHNAGENDLRLKIIFSNIYSEYLLNDDVTSLGIESGIMQSFSSVISGREYYSGNVPEWVRKTDEIFHYEDHSKITLKYIAEMTGIHPAHLSRDFHKYFHCTMSEYLRKIKIENAVNLLAGSNTPLAEISYKCGFADQSHFTRTFKKFKGLTPLEYQNLILN